MGRIDPKFAGLVAVADDHLFMGDYEEEMHYQLNILGGYSEEEGILSMIPNEPPHDKTNKMTVRPAKTKVSLGIRPV